MTKLLHIDSSVLGQNSVSRKLTAAIVERLQQATPDLQTVYRDVTSTPLGHLSGLHLAAAQGATPEGALAADVAAGQAVLEEFLASDIVVIGAPMYNFTIPSQLKAWLDRILVAGKTFKYSEKGAVGLAGNKRVIIAVSRAMLARTTGAMSAIVVSRKIERRASTPSAQMPPASLPSSPMTPSRAWTTSSTVISSAGRASR